MHTMKALPLVIDLRPILLKNETTVGFLTCDNPIVLYNQLLEERRYASNTGLQSVGLQIFLPISADYTLAFIDSSVYGVGRRNKVFIKVTKVEDINQLNDLQILNAFENVLFDARRIKSEKISACFQSIRHQRRDKKVNLVAQESESDRPNTKRELVATFNEDLRYNLNLSFLKNFKRAIRAKDNLMSRIAVRNPKLCEEFDNLRNENTKK